MKVIVCGSRAFANREFVFNTLNDFHAARWITLLIEGGASGADSLAREWANGAKVSTSTFFADWDRFGFAAGPIRNQKMIDLGKPDAVIAFPGGNGTADMVRRAHFHGLEVIEPKWNTKIVRNK